MDSPTRSNKRQQIAAWTKIWEILLERPKDSALRLIESKPPDEGGDEKE